MSKPVKKEEKAEALARAKFADICDRKGRPSILHIERVARAGQTEDERTVGWLHDLVEDTDVTLDDLRAHGFSETIVHAVDAVSRRDGETYRQFIERIATSGNLAVRVKLNDLRDNRARCDELGPDEGAGLARRYDRAMMRLAPLVP